MFWKTRVGKQSCVHETFAAALDDWKSHGFLGAWIYPVFMNRRTWDEMKDFNGW